MEIRIAFVGGPLDGMTGFTDGLDELKVFFPEDNVVLAYERFNETVYAYSKGYSDRLSASYEDTVAFFTAQEPSSLRFHLENEDSD